MTLVRFDCGRAKELLDLMARAREDMQRADVEYRRACGALQDTGGNADGLESFRREGRSYAKAVAAFSIAAMNWLAFVERQGALGNPPA